MTTPILFKEYIWLVNTIYQARNITLEEINRKWVQTEMSGGVEMARNTFIRHRNAIENIFGIFIECDRKNGYKYYIGNPKVLTEDSIQNWMLSTLSVNSVLSESKGVYDRIILEKIPSDGENLHKFIDAMKRGVKVRVQYRRYGAGANKTSMKLEPIFVKLFGKRWYAIVKFPEPDGNLFSLSFDRILSLEVTDERFEYDKDFDPSAWFRECYGIVRDPQVPVERVVIRAFGSEAFYLRDLPLHHSQKEIATTDEYSDFELTLRATADFYGPLLARGSAIKVLEPQHIAEDIKALHQASVDLYK